MPPSSSESHSSSTPLFATISRLWPYLWPSERRDLQWRIYYAVILLFIAKFITILVPYAFKWATDALVSPSQSIWSWAPFLGPIGFTLLYALLRSLALVLTQGRDALFAAVAMNAVRRLATETFVHMHSLSLRFHLERKTGGLTRVLERGRTGIETLVRMVILQILPTILEFLLIIVVFWYSFDWVYVATILLMTTTYLWFTTVATNWRISIRRSMNESDTEANSKAIDSLLNYETVKYFGAEVRETHRYDKAMAQYEKTSVDSYVSLAILNTGQGVIFALGLSATMILALYDIRAGVHTIGDFIFINAILIQLSFPLNFIGTLYREVRQGIIDIEMMFQVLDQHPEIKDKPHARPLEITHGVIRFEDVHFAYLPERPILKGVSFEVPQGHTVAVVGPSGAGKSTLSRLLFRFYEPQKGQIFVDDQDIADVTQASLRKAIGMVPQDTVLFNDTIGYNIRYGQWDASPEAVEAAAQSAQIDRFIRMIPEGYDTQVGERGLKLSGGEKQRVAIARTLLKSPPLLILDEATSALDSFTEREIQSALEQVSKGRTTLVIAHRLSTIINADQILVLDHGVIKERGTHDALLSLGGIYARMWQRQREIDAATEILQRVHEEEAQEVGESTESAH